MTNIQAISALREIALGYAVIATFCGLICCDNMCGVLCVVWCGVWSFACVRVVWSFVCVQCGDLFVCGVVICVCAVW